MSQDQTIYGFPLKTFENVRKENAFLKAELSKYEDVEAENVRLKEENDRLRCDLKEKEKKSIKTESFLNGKLDQSMTDFQEISGECGDLRVKLHEVKSLVVSTITTENFGWLQSVRICNYMAILSQVLNDHWIGMECCISGWSTESNKLNALLKEIKDEPLLLALNSLQEAVRKVVVEPTYFKT